MRVPAATSPVCFFTLSARAPAKDRELRVYLPHPQGHDRHLFVSQCPVARTRGAGTPPLPLPPDGSPLPSPPHARSGARDLCAVTVSGASGLLSALALQSPAASLCWTLRGGASAGCWMLDAEGCMPLVSRSYITMLHSHS